MTSPDLNGPLNFQLFSAPQAPEFDRIELTLSFYAKGRYKCRRCGSTGKVELSCHSDDPVLCPECGDVIKNIDDQTKWS